MKCFWGYSNHPHKVKENIEEAVNQINKDTIISVKTWESMNIDGNFVIDEILKEIDDCDVFLCELSNLNYNVLFELGYAIAKKKEIRIFINQSLQNVKEEFNNFNLLNTIGFVNYVNSGEILNSLWNLVKEKEEKTDILSSIISRVITSNYSNLLYMKSFYETNSSISLTRAVEELNIKLIVDDPKEVFTQTLDWYVKNLITCNGFLSHLHSEEYANNNFYNSKVFLISGIALGLNIPMLVLVEEPFKIPTDFLKIIKVYSGKNGCVNFLKEWYSENKEIISSKESFQKHTQQEIRAFTNLQKINLGENIAENESEKLLDYFVETSSFQEALNRNLSIFIGRKGTGKTANLYSLADTYNKKNCHVCVVKPVGYEIEGVLENLKKLTNAERGYLIESVWKYLIYTELLKSIYEKLQNYPPHKELDKVEKGVIDFVEDHKTIIVPEFSIRLESVMETLSGVKCTQNNSLQDYQLKVSELLHDNIINRLRSIIGDYCSTKEKIVILIDNLDKAWQSGTDLELLSNFLFGLLDIGNSVIRDFAKESNWKKPVNLSLIIFLREDIFALMEQYFPERDKLQVSRISWDDEEILLRVIEERIQNGDNVDVWAKYFCKTVNQKDVKKFITSNIIPRPRDIITLIKQALGNAVSRKHILIEEKDLVDSLTEYSTFALNALMTELLPAYPQIGDFFYELSAESEIIKRSTLNLAMENVGIPDENRDSLIRLLCKMSFLGVEIKKDIFEFSYNEDQFRKYDAIARKNIIRNNVIDCRYKIHKAFHVELMIETEDSIKIN